MVAKTVNVVGVVMPACRGKEAQGWASIIWPASPSPSTASRAFRDSVSLGALAGKGSSKADTEAELQAHESQKTAEGKELMATMAYIKSLHAECDWLLQYFDARKEACTGEIDSLKKAKAVLSGADYSLLLPAHESRRH